MIAKLIGGKNDGALMKIPFEEDDDVLPFSIAVRYKQGDLLYELQHADFAAEIAIYEYSGVVKRDKTERQK